MSARIGKTFVFSGLALGAGAMYLAPQAHGATLAGWDFENLLYSNGSAAITAAAVGPIAADTGSGSAFGSHAASTTVYSTPAGNGSQKSMSSNVWANGDYYEFRTSSIGATDLSIAFDQTRSGTGPNSFDIQYSTDGSAFTSFQSYTLAGSTFSTGSAITATAGVNFAFDLSAIDSIENLSTVYFRLKSTGLNSSGGTSLATAGSNRVDNVYVTGTVPEPTSAALLTVAAAALVGRRRSK